MSSRPKPWRYCSYRWIARSFVLGAGWSALTVADGFSVPADADGVPDGALAGVDADGCEGFASGFAFDFSGPHPHATTATHAVTTTLTIVRVLIQIPSTGRLLPIKSSRRIPRNGSRPRGLEPVAASALALVTRAFAASAAGRACSTGARD
ncbi:hypothetical protein OHA37_00615 [Streptomyces sp. NBC_00335]|uniref:hypothetical protein n=1 Tax=unclassified Streptomyces TaxID=2593676 RepID=UPI002257E410|nr:MULTISPECIES: hypothetical protein [unclassified Streptomyces]MCX5410269.1 hypothetical protein [Streptomyces sp. NBC_00086]